MGMFGSMFNIIHIISEEEEESLIADYTHASRALLAKHEHSNGPFVTTGETSMTMYRMMLGDFERDWFASPISIILFLSYSFIIVILVSGLSSLRQPLFCSSDWSARTDVEHSHRGRQ